MTREVILVTDQVFGGLDYERQEAAKAGFDLVLSPARSADAMANLAAPDRVRAIYNTYFGPVDGPLMDRFRNIKGIVRCGIGLDTIDLPAARERKIKVANVPDYCIEEVASHALALFLGLARKLSFSDALVRRGSWSIPAVKPMTALSHYTCGVIGLGRIGKRLAEMIQPLVGKVIYYDPAIADRRFERAELETVYQTADAIFLHVPLTEQTRGLLDRNTFAKLAKKPLVINVSRGGLIVTEDLVETLRAGRVSGAGLDIIDGIGDGVTAHPLFGFDNVVITPHSAWYSEQAMVRLRENAIAEAIRLAKGEEPRNRVA
jgi:D-3-phosphoglycerate dehydrogenase / 2-oxoglutarate reductase